MAAEPRQGERAVQVPRGMSRGQLQRALVPGQGLGGLASQMASVIPISKRTRTCRG
ncbi:hypothetical protein ACN28S_57400 [Cystobacter fuscus]